MKSESLNWIKQFVTVNDFKICDGLDDDVLFNGSDGDQDKSEFKKSDSQICVFYMVKK